MPVNSCWYFLTFPQTICTVNLRCLFEVIEGFSPFYDKVVIMGDLNSRIGQFEMGGEHRVTRDKIVNRGGKELINEIMGTGLLVANGSSNGDEKGEFTFIHSNKAGKSVVDLCLMTPNLSSCCS
jgi:hypothetical protein